MSSKMRDNSGRSKRGLTEAEARQRLQAEGFNELPKSDRRTPLHIAVEVLREPMLALLLCASAIYLLLGDLKEALILSAFATMSVAITVYQESRTERVLEALRDLTSPRALVIRDGVRMRVAGREVARGDTIVLVEGDRIPADAILFESHDLEVDESLLTGESLPVRKIAVSKTSIDPGRPGGDDLPFVYSGSLVVRGSGAAEVIATGSLSQIGKIGQSLYALQPETPRLQLQTALLVRLAAAGGAAVSLIAVVLYGTLRGGWLDAILAGIAIGMAMLPEEFPVVLAVFMAMGAWRISHARVLTRRAAAIEALGSTTVLCTDKTGTLTENRMTIAELRIADGDTFSLLGSSPKSLPARFQELAFHGLLASAPEPFDPMEKAFHDLAGEHFGRKRELTTSEWRLAREYGLRPELLAITHAWQADKDRNVFTIAAKGAPEAIAMLCRLDETSKANMRAAVDSMAQASLRVLGVAAAVYRSGSLPSTPHDFAFEFLGLVGLADPLRPEVTDAVRECRTAGIRVVMITGDYPATAKAIAAQAGIDASHVLTGDELEKLNDVELANRAKDTAVFARIMPEQKLRIVQALKADGEIVAMTGDGVNDAPSLKAAHIGIAMGGRGTDVAREASSIVLLDNDFNSIVKTVRLGRRIYDNLRKAMSFIFAAHVPIAGLALLPLILVLPIILTPIHIAFLEMIIDPVCSLVFEAETDEKDIMDRPPRPHDEQLFSWPLVGWSILQGSIVLVLVATVYLFAVQRGMPDDETRVLTFFTLVVSIISLILINRSFSSSLISALRRPNPALLWILLTVTATLGLTIYARPVGELFRFGPLHFDDLVISLCGGLVILLVLEGLKPLWRRHLRY